MTTTAPSSSEVGFWSKAACCEGSGAFARVQAGGGVGERRRGGGDGFPRSVR